ncbi:MAG: hypothetical protein ACRENP_14420 [Longimicrobiales bacterium]
MGKLTYMLCATLVFGACSSTPEPPQAGIPAPPGAICTMEARPAIAVEPIDRSTGRLIDGMVTVIVRDGIYTDTAQARVQRDAPTISAAYERAGTYIVQVLHPRYREWESGRVPVTRDECHVRTVRLRAELRPVDR